MLHQTVDDFLNMPVHCLVEAVQGQIDPVIRNTAYASKLINAVTGDDNVIRNVTYFENYRLGKNIMLFNIQE